MDDDTFDLPGVTPAAEATVKRLTWETDTRELNLGLTLPDSFTGYSTWTIHVGGQQASFAGITPNEFQTGRFRFVFTSFFTAGNAPSTTTGEEVEVCITTDGSGCPDDSTTADTTLSALTLTYGSDTEVALDPVFAAATTVYTASADNDVATVTVAATATAAGATVAYSPEDADTSTAGHQVALSEGANTITVTVTNGSDTQDYTVTVTREAAAGATALLWSATMTVRDSTGHYGYCGDPCPLSADGPDPHGSLADKGDDGNASADSFTNPGTSAPVTVTIVGRFWGGGGDGDHLSLGLSPLPDETVYGEWTLDWNGEKQIKLSEKSRLTGTGDTVLRFDDFFKDAGISALSGGDMVTVCLTTDGSKCDGTGGGGTADTTLSALTLTYGSDTEVALDPVFAAATTVYTASADNDVATVTVAATATAAGATVAYSPEDAGHQHRGPSGRPRRGRR